MATGFLHNGLDLGAYLEDVLRKPAYVGVVLGHAALRQVADAHRLRISFEV